MSVSVIICTYQSPRELDFALCGMSMQVVPPSEVLVADDGSGDETRDLIEYWQGELPFPLIHCWHVDKGFRKSRIVNEAVRRSSGDFLMFLDGDSFPHSHWVADFMSARSDRLVLCGRRVKLGPEFSERLTREQILTGKLNWLDPELLMSALRRDTQRLGLGIRVPKGLARLFHLRPRRLMGVNYGLPREAFFRVNGYDERWTFYGREDLDLELRLKRADYKFYPLLNRAIVYHVYHKERERSDDALELTAAQESADWVRCGLGVETGGTFDPQL